VHTLFLYKEGHRLPRARANNSGLTSSSFNSTSTSIYNGLPLMLTYIRQSYCFGCSSCACQ
jgi:hypothetical protein